MKKPEKEYEVEYPAEEDTETYYGTCESCNSCNQGNSSCGLLNK
ncbi:MAG: hypothetical protein PUC73_12415 [Lachnospiraceae bacterium]|nr:hypothetical protein [Lachnospiraceae bacterium]